MKRFRHDVVHDVRWPFGHPPLITIWEGQRLIDNDKNYSNTATVFCGITYLALNEALNQRVAIKEYLPNEFAVRDAHNVVVAKSEEDRKTFQWGLERFSQEARLLERFDHPNIVRFAGGP